MKIKDILLSLIFVGMLYSCSVNSQVHLAVDQTGIVKGTIQVNEGFVNYYQQLLKSLGMVDKLSEGDIFQEEGIRLVMDSYPKVKLLNLKKINPQKLQGEFSFNSLSSIMDDAIKIQSQSVLNLKDNKDGTTTLKLLLNRDNVAQVLAIGSGVSSDPTAATFLPSKDNPVSEEEYTELVVYMLEQQMPKIKDLLKESFVTINMTLPRPIKSLEGDATYKGNLLKLKYPLVRLLSLENPLDITVIY